MGDLRNEKFIHTLILGLRGWKASEGPEGTGCEGTSSEFACVVVCMEYGVYFKQLLSTGSRRKF